MMHEMEGKPPTDVMDAVLKYENENTDEPDWIQCSQTAINAGTVQVNVYVCIFVFEACLKFELHDLSGTEEQHQFQE